MTITVYRSTDAGAPQITNVTTDTADVAAVLEACLVTGYGSKAGQGWTKPYSSGSTVVLRQPVASSNGFYLRIDASHAYGVSGMRLDVAFRGYEAMSSADTGTGPFPTVTQATYGVYQMRRVDNSATLTEWDLFTNGRIFYFITRNAASPAGTVLAFGDITPTRQGDMYATLLSGNDSPRHPGYPAQGYARFPVTAAITSSTTGNFMARSFTQLGTAVAVGKHTDTAKTNGAATWGSDGLTYPNPADNKLWFVPAWVHEANRTVRGVLPGIWVPCHAVPLANRATFSGTGEFAGRIFEAVSVAGGTSPYGTQGQIFIELTGDW